jgi:hypothetical protein
MIRRLAGSPTPTVERRAVEPMPFFALTYCLSTGMPGESAAIMHPYLDGRAYTIAKSR